MSRPTFVQVRTASLFVCGLLGVAYVTLIDSTDRPTLLILFGAMLGLPLFLRNDERHPPPPGIPPPPTVSPQPNPLPPSSSPSSPLPPSTMSEGGDPRS